MYVDPDYEQIHLVGQHEAPCYDALRRTWVVHTVARMQAGLCEPRNGDELLAPESLQPSSAKRIEQALREHGPMTVRALCTLLGYEEKHMQNVLRKNRGVLFEVVERQSEKRGQWRNVWHLLSGHRITERNKNIARAVEILRKQGAMPRQRLADLMNVHSNTVSNLCALSDELVLRERHAHEHIIMLPGQEYIPPPRYTPTALTLVDCLREHGALTIQEIVAETGMSDRNIGNTLQRYRGDLFEIADVSYTKYKRKRYHWGLAEQEQT